MGRRRKPPVVKTCVRCNQPFEVQQCYAGRIKYCGRQCYYDDIQNLKRKIPTYRNRSSEVTTWTKGLTALTDHRIATRNAKIAATVVHKIISGTWHRGFVQKKYDGVKNGGCTIYTRSSWELAYATTLDADESVISWKYEPVAIPYVYQEKTRNYIPDFLVVRQASTTLVEIKPKTLSEKPLNTAKFLAAKHWCVHECMDFCILSEDTFDVYLQG